MKLCFKKIYNWLRLVVTIYHKKYYVLQNFGEIFNKKISAKILTF